MPQAREIGEPEVEHLDPVLLHELQDRLRFDLFRHESLLRQKL
jgi:hypothetical protein